MIDSQRYRFYAELPNNRDSKKASKKFPAFTVAELKRMSEDGKRCNVVALPLKESGAPYWQGSTMNADAFVAVQSGANSVVCGGSVSRDYLRFKCLRVSEELARKLHPNLFSYLEK